jgi:threonine dehydrogenase-like Zn-dependent dehydrogenase
LVVRDGNIRIGDMVAVISTGPRSLEARRSGTTLTAHPLWDEERARETAINLFRDGLLTGRDIVTPIVSFEGAPQALATAFTQPEQSIKSGIRF